MAQRFILPVLACVALMLPLLIASPQEPGCWHIGLPCVYSGDEPHYLVSINSLISNGTLDLSKAYQAVHLGAPFAGKYFRGGTLDHHTVWFENGTRRQWSQAYSVRPEDWSRDLQGHWMPKLLNSDQPAPVAGHVEYSTHPYGLALILAPVLYWFRNTDYVEPLAICCSTGSIILAMFFFRWLAFKYTEDRTAVNLICMITFLGTPAWCYARTLFNEPYMLCFVIGAYSLALRNRMPLIVGSLIAVGMLMKPTFLIFLAPLCLRAMIQRKFLVSALLAIVPAITTLLILVMNLSMFGSAWQAAQVWQPGDFFNGAGGNLFSWKYGYLLTAPVIVVALFCWPAFIRHQRADALLIGSGVILHFCFFSCYGSWPGATCYAARYMVPLIPLVFIALVQLPGLKIWQNVWARHAIVSLAVMSVIINAAAAMPYWAYWDSNPILFVLQKGFNINAEW